MNNTELSRRVAELIGVTEDYGLKDKKAWCRWRLSVGVWNKGKFSIPTAEAQVAFEDWLIGQGWCCMHDNNGYSYSQDYISEVVIATTRLEAIRAVVEALSK